MKVAIAALLIGAAPLQGQGTFTLDRFLDLERVGTPAISPDGKSIVYTRIQVNRIADRYESMLWQVDDNGANPRQVAPGHHAAWSPDGKRLAWLADVDGTTQLVVRTIGGGDATLTTGSTSPIAFRWSPDGQQIAFTRQVPFGSPVRLTSPIPAEGGNWAADPSITTRLRSGEGWVQLFVVSAMGGEARQVTAGGFDVGARDTGVNGAIPFDWLSGGASIVFDGLIEPDAERRYQQSQLYVVEVASGTLRRLTATDGFWHTPVVSPDGKWIAFSGFGEGAAGYRAQPLHVIRPDGGGFRTLTAGLDRDAVGATWDPDNQTLWFAAEDRGAINSYSVSLKDGKVKPGSNGLHRMELAAIARKGGYGLAIRSTASLPWELVRFPLKKPWEIQAVTHLNDALAKAVRFGEVEEVEYRSGEALVQGWLVKPPDFTVGNKRPLHVELHGGPHAMHHLGFSPTAQQMAAAGYLVLLLNPRGSTGYGSDFGAALGTRYPGVDLDDVIAGVDEVISRGWVDTTKVFVGGCGGGGMLAAWVVGRSTRFAAASVRCPGNDWLAALPGPLGAEEEPFFSRPWRQDRLDWSERSPLHVVGAVRAPVLIVAGDCRRALPIDEGGEWFSALQLRGVPSALVRLSDECGAATRHPSNWIRTRQLILDWYTHAITPNTMTLRTAILGAATPLGATLVRVAAERGDRLAVVAAQPGRIPLFADLARERPDQVVLVGDSRRTPEEVVQAVTEALGGAVDRLILAGWQEHAGPTLPDQQANVTLPKLDPALVLAHVDQNAVLPLALARAFRLPLRSGKAPAILAITSWLGSFTDRTDGGHYGQAISAAALQMAMRTLALDLEPDSIRVLIGNPGLYRTALHGPAVQPSADEVATGLLATLEAADDSVNGRLVDWRGRVLAW